MPPAGTRTVSDSRPVPGRPGRGRGGGQRRVSRQTPGHVDARPGHQHGQRPGRAGRGVGDLEPQRAGAGRGDGPGVEVAARVAGGRADPLAVDEQVQRPVAGGDRPAGVRRPGPGRATPPARRVRDLRRVGAVPVEPGGADPVGGALAQQEPARRPTAARRHAHLDVALVGQVEHPGRRDRARLRGRLGDRLGRRLGGGPGVAGVPAGPPGAAGPAQRDVHVVAVPQGVRAAPEHRAAAVGPGRERVVRGVDRVVPDQVHDAHPAGQRVLVALGVGGEDPVQEVAHGGPVARGVHVGRPVEGAALLVLGDPAVPAGAGDPHRAGARVLPSAATGTASACPASRAGCRWSAAGRARTGPAASRRRRRR